MKRQRDRFLCDTFTGESIPWRWGELTSATDDHWVVRRKSDDAWEVVSDVFSESPNVMFEVPLTINADTNSPRTPFWTGDGRWLIVPAADGRTQVLDRTGKVITELDGDGLGALSRNGVVVRRGRRICFLVWDSARSEFVQTKSVGDSAFHGASPYGASALVADRTWYGFTPFEITNTNIPTDVLMVPATGRTRRTTGDWLSFEWSDNIPSP